MAKKGSTLVCVPCGQELVVSREGTAYSEVWCCGLAMEPKPKTAAKRVTKKAAKKPAKKKAPAKKTAKKKTPAKKAPAKKTARKK